MPILKKKTFLFGIIMSCAIFTLGIIGIAYQKYQIRNSSTTSIKSTSQNTLIVNDTKRNIPIASELQNNRLDAIEKEKEAWAKRIQNHPYNNRPYKSKEEWKKIPKKDRPDLAMEQNFLMTMDPSLSEVPYERQIKAYKYLDSKLRNKAAISNVNWTERGPNNVGGRVRALVFDPNDVTHKKVWAGGIGGGLWYTNDITATPPTWNKIDDFWDNIAVSCIAFNPNNTSDIYVGTGEGWFNGGSQIGTGIWKSSDAGVSWSQLANTEPGAYNSSSNFHYVQKLVIKSDGTIFAATRGYYANRGGIMRSTDNGATWSRVLSIYDGTGHTDKASDIEIAANGDLYASIGIKADGTVYKSLNADNGASGTWTDLSTNVGIANAERIELACAPSDANVIYAIADGGSGSIDVEWFKKSINGGTTWTTITTPLMIDGTGSHFTRGQAFYDLIIQVHPTNTNCVLAGGIDLHRTTDGGTTWTGISHWYGDYSKPEVHADQHAIQFRPGSSDEVIFGNDGGIFYSTNAGDIASTPSFTSKNTGFNVTQFYACAAKNEVNSNYFLAGAQDNGSQKFTTPQVGSTNEVSGGDGAYCHIDQSNPDIQITSYTYNSIYRSLDGGNSFTNIISDATGNFINQSEYDSQRKILYRSADANFIKRVSDFDGTFNNLDIALALNGSQIASLKMSTYNDVLIIGAEDGRVYKLTNPSAASPSLTRIDNGTTPITTTGYVSSFDIGADDNHILVSYSNYGVTSVWETTDGGTNWYSKEGDLPDMPIRSVLYNPNNRDEVLVATEIGVWSTDDFGSGTTSAPDWEPSNSGLAHTRCDMLAFRPADNMVVVATHGRGLFTSDVFVTNQIADFSYDNSNSISCSGSLTVDFTDGSLLANNNWSWDINGDGSEDFTTQNPQYTWTSTDRVAVKLDIDNGAASVTKNIDLLIMSSGPTVSTGSPISSNSNNANGYAIGISHFSIGEISNSTSNNDGELNDYTCTSWSVLKENTTYSVSITTGTANSEGAALYIDYNDNGTFEGSEQAITFPANTDGSRTSTFTTPSSGITADKGIRLRVVSKYGSIPTSATDVSSYGQAEDYTVYFATPTGPLPVELISFNAECNTDHKEIEWQTVSESDNAYFTLLRSHDGIYFEEIHRVKGKDQNKQANRYSYNDYSVTGEQLIYQLRQTDIDGETKVMGETSANCNTDDNLTIFPNPSKGIINITGISSGSFVRIYNPLGEEIHTSKATDSNHQINISQHPSGSYQIVILKGTKIQSKTIILKKD